MGERSTPPIPRDGLPVRGAGSCAVRRGRVHGRARRDTADRRGAPVPRWGIGQIHGQFRVAWHNEVGSQVQESDYLRFDGRLFLARVSEYGYPDDETEYDRLDASTVTTARFKPDGTGTLELTDESDRTEVTYFKDIPDIDEHWMDPPTFGAWTALIDRDYRASRYR